MLLAFLTLEKALDESLIECEDAANIGDSFFSENQCLFMVVLLTIEGAESNGIGS
jgi:hypothetical protein